VSRFRGRSAVHGRRARDQRGASLVEAVATVSLLGLVLVTVYAGIWSTQNAVEGTSERLGNLDEARVLMAATSKDVRTAVRLSAGSTPFTVADDYTTTFYANLNTTDAPKQVRIRIDAQDRLIEEVWTADASSQPPNYTYSGTPTVRLVGRYVANTEAAIPLFTYLDANNAPLTNTPLNATDRLAIKAVRIEMVVKKATTYDLDSTTLVNRVRLPNLDYNAVAG
jgi:hypothetical protein